MIKLDKIDATIMRELESDGRLSNVQLAERVNLSASACLRRVQQLEKHGFIKGYRAVIDRKLAGQGFLALVGVGLSRHLAEDQQAFERAIAREPAVTECHNITGKIEYMLRVEVESLDAYKDFHMNVLGKLQQVSSLESFIVLASPKDLRA